MSSYDAMFNDGMLRVARKASSLNAPQLWPSHVSSLSKHTNFNAVQDEAIPSGFHSDFMWKRDHPAPAAAHGSGKSRMPRTALMATRARAAAQTRLMPRANLPAPRPAGSAPPTQHGSKIADSRKWSWQDGKA